MLATILPSSPRPFRRLTEFPELQSARPKITNVRVTDLDNDGRADILACDGVRHTVWWCHQDEQGSWVQESVVPPNSIAVPAHSAVADVNQDGTLDIVVAGLGYIWPTDDRIGQVVLLSSDGSGGFAQKTIAEDLRRVTDVQPADLDGDGDIDFAVAEFGYLHGRVLWLENVGDGQFADHRLLSLPGCIHVPIDDYDGDGDPDVAAVISQNDEEVWIFENTTDGSFEPIAHKVWETTNFDRGLSGMVTCDLDSDGDTDFLLSAGDNLELRYPCPQPEHGCIWLENCGNFEFRAHTIAKLGGTYAADAADLDGDGDIDVALVSMFNDWRQPGATSLAWLENDGDQNFSAWQIASEPTYLCTVACGDLTGDGVAEIVSGSLKFYPPYDGIETGLNVWTGLTDFSGEIPR